MGIRSRFFAATYDRFMKESQEAGLAGMRQQLLAAARGDVLEIGAGTGLNLAHYGPAIRSLTITEPEQPMLRRLARRAADEAPHATVLRAPAEDLPFADSSFDTVVATLVLCGVDDQPRALREIKRVLRPDGQFLFLEHLRSRDPKVARLQNRLNWLNRLVVCCDCNRPTLDTMREAGFEVRADDTEVPKAPPFVKPAAVGMATVPVMQSQD